jgi:NAD+ diphosphatase
LTSAAEFFVDPSKSLKKDRVFIYHDRQLLVRGKNLYWSIPEIQHALNNSHRPLLIDIENQIRHLAVHLDKDVCESIDAELVPLWEIMMEVDYEQFRVPGLGGQLLNWYSTHRFCGSCGSHTQPHELERAMVCASCKLSFYPRINPCVIVLVTRGEEFLLAKHARARSGFYSCLAGFMEVGETPEQTVVREVKEEVGIDVENVRYIKSQSWPFPSQLMLGFFADYKSGVLQEDKREIEEAAWFSPADFPPVPSAAKSVAGELIAHHLGLNGY